MVDFIDAIQSIKKMEVGLDVGEKVSIALPIVASDDDTVGQSKTLNKKGWKQSPRPGCAQLPPIRPPGSRKRL